MRRPPPSGTRRKARRRRTRWHWSGARCAGKPWKEYRRLPNAEESYTPYMKKALVERYKGQSPAVYVQEMHSMYNAGREGRF